MASAGILVVDKPGGITSRAAADRAGRAAGARRSGHAGTLDPLATGVLVVCLDRATLLSRFLAGGDKVYSAVALLGVETDTFDVDGRVSATADASRVSPADVRRAARGLTGDITQEPPPYSAVKHEGRPLHSYARAGVAVRPAPREVRVDWMELEGLETRGDRARASLTIGCGPGTYVRRLVSDLGSALGCGACVEELRRLRSGPFDSGGAVELGALESGETGAEECLLSMEEATAWMPTVEVGRRAALDISMGKPLSADMGAGERRLTGPARVIDDDGRLVAVLGPPRAEDPESLLGRPLRVIRPSTGDG